MPWTNGDLLTPANLNTKAPEFIGVYAEDPTYGVVSDGSTDNTTALQAAIDAAESLGLYAVRLGPGSTLTDQITLSSYVKLLGMGMGVTTLKAKSGANSNLVVNADASNTDIEIADLDIDGNYANQSSGSNGIHLNFVSNSKISRVRVQNCRGSGIVVGGGSGNILVDVEATNNGVAVAGYGIYIYNSSRNKLIGCKANQNSIGFVIEASGVGEEASHNQLFGCSAQANREEFTMSGAGFHEEASNSGTCQNNQFFGIIADSNEGTGIQSTAGSGTIVAGANIRDNLKAGGSFVSCTDFVIAGGTWLDNAASAAAGYKAGITIDDTAVSPVSTGVISGVRISGSSESIKTFVASRIIVVGGDMTGCTTTTLNFAAGSNDRAIGVRGHAGITRASVNAAATYELTGSKGPAFHLTAAGNITLDAAADQFEDGDAVTVQILNNTGGAITVTLGADFRGTFTAPAAGQKRSMNFVWDDSLPQFVPVGAISADF